MSDNAARSGFSPFPLGQVAATPSALAALERSGVAPEALLGRHGRGDWGELDECDRQTNRQSLSSGGRLLSAYNLPHQVRIWIITEADRSATTILLPGDY